MTNNPTSSLMQDVRASFLLTNPATFNVEYSREAYYSSLEFFNNFFVKPQLTSIVNLANLPKSFFTLFDSTKTVTSEAMKSQYRPMRRGILNMIRLHGTGAVAMPIEIRLQMLASSKDVIHS